MVRVGDRVRINQLINQFFSWINRLRKIFRLNALNNVHRLVSVKR